MNSGLNHRDYYPVTNSNPEQQKGIIDEGSKPAKKTGRG
jgi:hypothetical protein